MSTTVFCRYCGDHIIDSAKDCQHCGAEQHLPSAFGGVASKNAKGFFPLSIVFYSVYLAFIVSFMVKSGAGFLCDLPWAV